MKKLILVAFLAISVMAFAPNLNAKPVYQGHFHYQGTDGKWYWVEHFKDDVTGDRFTKFWINGGSANYGNGHQFPSWPHIVGGNNDGDTVNNNPTLPNINDVLYVMFIAHTSGLLEIKIEENSVIDIVTLTGSVILSGIPINGGTTYQQIQMPNWFNTEIVEPYGLVVRCPSHAMGGYGRAFYFNGSTYYSKAPN